MEEVVGFLFNLEVQVEQRPAVGVVTDEGGAPVEVGALLAKGLAPRADNRPLTYIAPDETGDEVRTVEEPARPVRSGEVGPDQPASPPRPVPPSREKARPQANRPKRKKPRRG